MPDDNHAAAKPEAARFQDTDWNLVQTAAGNPADTRAREAFAKLCQAYEYPLCGYMRRKGQCP